MCIRDRCTNKRWVRWETEWSFDGKLCQEYSYQKLSKSGNWFSCYGQKCRGCFILRRSVCCNLTYSAVELSSVSYLSSCLWHDSTQQLNIELSRVSVVGVNWPIRVVCCFWWVLLLSFASYWILCELQEGVQEVGVRGERWRYSQRDVMQAIGHWAVFVAAARETWTCFCFHTDPDLIPTKQRHRTTLRPPCPTVFR